MRSGSRPLAFAGRLLLWSAVALVLVRGTIDLLRPDADETPAEDSTGEGRPATNVEAAEAFAVRFASDFLTLNEEDSDARRDALEAYVAPDVDLDAVWDGDGVQAVSHAVPVSTSVEDDGKLTVLVAAQVDGPRWLHLAVPVSGDADNFVVTGLPALVAAPPNADVELTEPEVDSELSSRLQPTVESFFAAYGAGEQAELDRYVLPGHTVIGLDGAYVVDDVSEVAVMATDGADSPRRARATVGWSDPLSGAGFSATYDLMLTEEDGRWYVERLTAAQG
jgi:hypothetical protein